MATVRLALAGCIEATEGPWTRAQGNEKGLRISGLMGGERVELQLRCRDENISVYHLQPGTFPFPTLDIEKYRVIKHVDNCRGLSHTHVEVILES